MDRFIAIYYFVDKIEFLYLKSNMDRFIEIKLKKCKGCVKNLKSNMDRFIAVHGMRTNYTILI